MKNYSEKSRTHRVSSIISPSCVSDNYVYKDVQNGENNESTNVADPNNRFGRRNKDSPISWKFRVMKENFFSSKKYLHILAFGGHHKNNMKQQQDLEEWGFFKPIGVVSSFGSEVKRIIL